MTGFGGISPVCFQLSPHRTRSDEHFAFVPPITLGFLSQVRFFVLSIVRVLILVSFGEDLSDGWVGNTDQREELLCGCSVNSFHPYVALWMILSQMSKFWRWICPQMLAEISFICLVLETEI